MSEKAIKYKSGILAGIVEVLVTHPIDYYKTKQQFHAFDRGYNNFNLKNMYSGISSRIYGIAPMRLIFWCTQDLSEIHLADFKYKYAIAGALAGSIQTLVDYPIEQVKIRRMIYKDSYSNIIKDMIKSENLISGFSFTFLRNVGFATIFNHILKNNSNNDSNSSNFILAAGSGFLSSLITQPLDYFKTIIQSSKNKKILVNKIFNDSIKNNDFLIFFKGGLSRSSISFLSMGIGYSIYEFCKKNL